MRAARWLPFGLVTVALVGGCLPPIRRMNAFSSRFPDNNREHVQRVFTSLSAADADRATNALNVPLVVAVRQTTPRAVVAIDAQSGRTVWATELDAQSAPEILGDVVVLSIGARVVGLDLQSGRRLWDHDLGAMPFQGAARDGDRIVIVASLGANGNGARVGKVVAVDAQSGRERWSHEVIGILGRPAASAGQAFIPWDRQSLAVLDMATGVERARVRATDDVLSWAFAAPQGLFYGSRGAYRWTPRSASGTRGESAYLANPLEGVPGDPPLFRDAFAGSSGARTARDKIRFAFLPRAAQGDQIAVAHDALFLVYYRFVIALEASTGAVRWARSIGPDDSAPAGASETAQEAARRAQAAMSQYDIESVTVTPTSLVVISGNGRLRAIDPRTGAIQGASDLGVQIGAITTDMGGFRPPSGGAQPAPEGSPREQLVSLIRDADNRLVPMRAYLVRLLTRDQAPEVTRDLLELYRARSIPGPLRTEVSTALRARETGEQHLLAAIDNEDDHFNFLENRQAPPLDVIAPTLASMGAREAVPLLIQHLYDHETPAAWLPIIIDAIGELEDANAVPQLQAFLQRYRADSSFAGDRAAPLASAAAAVFKLGDATARQWLTALSQDAGAHQELRTAIAGLFDAETRGNRGRTDEQRIAEARAELEGRLNALRAGVNAYPATLTQEQFDDEWNNHLDELRACAQSVLTRRPDLNEIRITLTVRSEPPSTMFQTTPPPARNAPRNPTADQRIAAYTEQQAWVERQINGLEAYESQVRTAAYSPRDTEMQTCMDAIVRPLHFAGFGRNIASRQFVQRISTVRAAVRQTTPQGFGTPRNTNVLVPWFLVSSPSLDASGQLVVTTPGVTTTTTTTGTGTTTTTTTGGPPTLSGSGTPPTLPGTGAPPTLPGTGAPPTLPGTGAPPTLPGTGAPPTSGQRPPTTPPTTPPTQPPQLPPTGGATPPTTGGATRPWWEQ